MKKLITAILAYSFAVAVLLVPATPATVAAVDSDPMSGSSSGSGADPGSSISDGIKSIDGGDANTDDLPEQIKTITNVLLFVLGAIAVIMLIIGGIKYTTSNGDPQAVKSAKDTILYSVIGIIVAILSYAIVTWVVDSFTGNK